MEPFLSGHLICLFPFPVFFRFCFLNFPFLGWRSQFVKGFRLWLWPKIVIDSYIQVVFSTKHSGFSATAVCLLMMSTIPLWISELKIVLRLEQNCVVRHSGLSRSWRTSGLENFSGPHKVFFFEFFSTVCLLSILEDIVFVYRLVNDVFESSTTENHLRCDSQFVPGLRDILFITLIPTSITAAALELFLVDPQFRFFFSLHLYIEAIFYRTMI